MRVGAEVRAPSRFVVRVTMSAMGSDIQWFIARDGKQHGPLLDAEMRKLVELGHLRANDLVWRQGFPDWRPAVAVFPTIAHSAPLPFSSTRPTTSVPQSQRTGAAPSLGPRHEPVPGRTAGEAGEARWMPGAEPQSSEAHPATGSGRRVFAVAAALLLLAGVGTWLAYQNREALISLIGAGTKREAPTAEVAKAILETTATTETGDSAAAIEDRLQKSALWSLIKKEFPEWYEERVKEAAKLGAEGKSELEITQHLVEALVGLRRQHADKALAASTEKHKQLASAFLDNLRRLSEQSADACYSFISKGETSPAVVELMQNPQKSAQVEAQVLAIVAAISEGRLTPSAHAAPGKADYDVLATELGKLGWSQADIQLFADPKALAKAPHERVCKMVQDWFAAHLAIQDAGAQERLLFETLRPVVAG